MRRLFLIGFLAFILIFLYLTLKLDTIVDDDSTDHIDEIKMAQIETMTVDHNENTDVEFDFMNIDEAKNKSAPSPTIKVPNHWTNPCLDEQTKKDFKFCDESLSFEQRSQIFANSLHLDELYAQTNAWSQEIKRDDFPYIPFHDWWSEALHGLSVSSGVHFYPHIPHATQFPQVIALGSSFNKSLWFAIADIISTEARVFYNYDQTFLTFWSPNINIFRDPRFGRGQEVASEDPFINGVYAMNFVRGMQGNDSKYLKTSACCKHFIGYSMESARDNSNAQISEYDMNDSYLPPFEMCASASYGNADCVMCAYNQVNGVPSCLNEAYLTDVVRKKWNFGGYIVTDCYALQWIDTKQSNINLTQTQIIKKTLTAGIDLNCGNFLLKYRSNDSVIESMLKLTVSRLYTTYFRLGMFDANNPWNKLDKNHANSERHQKIAFDADLQSLILLKNKDNFLPISVSGMRQKKIALIGPNAKPIWQTMGNYLGRAPFWINCFEAFNEFANENNATLQYEEGCKMRNVSTNGIENALSIALSSDLIVFVLGLNKNLENERIDRHTLHLPVLQQNLLDKVLSECTHQNVILFVISGGCIDLSKYQFDDRILAMIGSGYGGMYQGKALISMIFHHNDDLNDGFCPTALTTQTWYKEAFIKETKMSNFRMPSDEDSGYKGRGYRYYVGDDVLYPFGYGLSYSSFSCSIQSVDDKFVFVKAKNIGRMQCGLVILIYYVPTSKHSHNLVKRLIAFDRIHKLQKNEEYIVKMEIYDKFYDSEEYTIDYKQKHGKFEFGGNCNN